MTLSEFLQKNAKILDELKIDYFITGGIAVGIWAKPRHTVDIDIVIKMQTNSKIENLVDKLKFIFKNSYCDYQTGFGFK